MNLELDRIDRGFAELEYTLKGMDDRSNVKLELEDYGLWASITHPTLYGPRRIKLYDITWT